MFRVQWVTNFGLKFTFSRNDCKNSNKLEGRASCIVIKKKKNSIWLKQNFPEFRKEEEEEEEKERSCTTGDDNFHFLLKIYIYIKNEKN